MMKTTLVGATLNEIEAMQVVLPELARSGVDEILIVDGGSTDGTVEFCREMGFTVLEHGAGAYGMLGKRVVGNLFCSSPKY